MCNSGKLSYSTRKIARQSRRELSKIYEKKYTVYKCGICNMYHLATKNGKSTKKGKDLQRTVLSIERFCNLSTRIERLTTKRRRELSGISKASKSNRRRCASVLD